MKTIFLTNDDGFDSYGLLYLRNSLQKFARVIVVAPAFEKSACGHGLCVNKPMKLIKIEKDFYKLDDGAPTDCVYIGIQELFDVKPDLLISGINIGSNMGEDITYSGTVAGAIEGSIQGIPSIAISQCIKDKYGEDNKRVDRNFELGINFICSLSKSILNGEYKIGDRKLLNINIPPIPKHFCKGIKVTQLGYRCYKPSVDKRINPRKQEYYWIGLNQMDWLERDNSDNLYINDNNECLFDSKKWNSDKHSSNFTKTTVISDFKAIEENCISITPIQLDNTSYIDINRLNHYMKTYFYDSNN
ncbi:5'/3'-nucleotidase SurE [Helicobacter muridarum]|uniref:5'-nucleotidase SurE n=1 Tax=Helicobacter muridarum TaxID=216 RepID=A0A099TXW7_9HELI|nr:5'/3'-nucleotidase SurE [Helicobacter muridarum]TLE00750.1 5'/3'-nucleotidase SurE [Helicobacter muridarum]STQ86570.1 SurE-like protein [Helicobacter muridarum]